MTQWSEPTEMLTAARRRVRYSLRGLLIIMALLCLGSAYLGSLNRAVQRDHAAVMELASRGYLVQFSRSGTSVDVSETLLGGLLGPAWDSYALDVSVQATRITQADDVPLLLKIRRLQGLSVQGDAIRDEELHELMSKRTIQGLVLDRCNVTDEGIHALTAYPELRYLHLHGTIPTDKTRIQFYERQPACDLDLTP